MSGSETKPPQSIIPETLPAMAAEIIRLRAIEEHAGLMRDAIESLSVGHAMRAETVRGALRLVVRAYDEGIS